MKYIKQLLYILLFSFLGELLQALIPLPIPAAIYGIVLLLSALCTGLLKAEKIADTAHFLISLLPLLFVAPAASILSYWDILSPHILQICVIVALTTVLVFAVSGLVTKLLLRKGGGQNG